MPDTVQGLILLLALFVPGYVAWKAGDLFRPTGVQIEGYVLVIEIGLLGALCLGVDLVSLGCWIPGTLRHMAEAWQGHSTFHLGFGDYMITGAVLLISPAVVGTVWGILFIHWRIQHKLLTPLFKLLRVPTRLSPGKFEVWDDVFGNRKVSDWVLFTVKDSQDPAEQRVVVGSILYASAYPHPHQVFLEKVKVYDGNGVLDLDLSERKNLRGVLIMEDGFKWVEVYDGVETKSPEPE